MADDLRVKLILEAVDHISSPMAKISAKIVGSTKAIGDALKKAGHATSEFGIGLKEGVARGLTEITTKTKAATDATDKLARATSRAGRASGRHGAISSEVSTRMAGLASRAGLLGTTLAGLGPAGLAAGAAIGAVSIAAAAAAAVTVKFARGVVDVAAKFENFAAILKITEGSAAGAQKSLDWVKTFARTTPFQVDETTDAFVRLRAYGLDPTRGLLASLGDAAAAMGKPLMQGVEAIADAVTGENERLKEFGIKAKKEGDSIVYEFTQGAKTMHARVDASNRAMIVSTLTAILNSKYKGAMAERAKTWDGMLSNLSDSWTNFQGTVADAGLFRAVKDVLSGILNTIDNMDKSGALKRIAASISKPISELVRAISDWIGAWITAQGGVEQIAIRIGNTIAGVKDIFFGAFSGIDPLSESTRRLIEQTDNFKVGLQDINLQAALHGDKQALLELNGRMVELTTSTNVMGGAGATAGSKTAGAFQGVLDLCTSINTAINAISAAWNKLAQLNEASKEWWIVKGLNSVNKAGEWVNRNVVSPLMQSTPAAPVATPSTKLPQVGLIPPQTRAIQPPSPGEAAQMSTAGRPQQTIPWVNRNIPPPQPSAKPAESALPKGEKHSSLDFSGVVDLNVKGPATVGRVRTRGPVEIRPNQGLNMGVG